MEDKRKKIMDRVQKLLSKAESTTFGPERDALMGKVDELMTEYAIAQHEIDALGKPEDRSKPELLDIHVCNEGNPLWYELTELALACAQLFDCKAVFGGLQYKGKYPITMKTVGFPESVRSAQALFVSLHAQLAGQLEPKYDHSLSYEENMVRFKAAGMGWRRMHEIFKAAGVMPDEPWERKIGVRFTSQYATYCRNNGIEQVKVNPKNYQKNFAIGFVEAIGLRVANIKYERERRTKDQTTSTGTSVALVLSDRQSEVEAAFNEFFPEVGRPVSGGQTKYNSAAQGAGRKAGKSADLGGPSVKGSRKALGS